MKLRKLLSLVILAVLLAFTACTLKPDKTSETEKESKTETSRAPVNPAVQGDSVTVCLGTSHKDWYGMERVLDYMKSIIYEDTGILTEIKVMSYMNINNEFPAGDEVFDDVDIIHLYEPSQEYEKGRVLDLSPYLNDMPYIVQEYGYEALAEMRYKGALPGIPTRESTLQRFGMALRTDLLNEAGYSENDLEYGDFEQLNEILRQIQAIHPEMIMIGDSTYDILDGDLTHVARVYDQWGVLMREAPNTIVNYYESDDFLELARYMKSWYEAGYIQKDIGPYSLPAGYMLRDGDAAGSLAAFSAQQIVEMNVNLEERWSYDVTVFYLRDAVKEYYLQPGYCITSHCRHPEQAAVLLDYMFQSRTLNDTMLWGIEGFTWEETGEANVADYPEDLDYSYRKHAYSLYDACFNPRVAHVFAPMRGDFYTETVYQSEAQAYTFPSYGFTFEEAPSYYDWVGSFWDIAKEYLHEIISGRPDNPEMLLKEMNEELLSAGLNEYIAIKQQALDDWMAER